MGKILDRIGLLLRGYKDGISIHASGINMLEIVNSSDQVMKILFPELSEHDCKLAIQESLNLNLKNHNDHELFPCSWNTGLHTAQTIYCISRLANPKTVVEVGVGNGVLSKYLQSSLHKNDFGILHSFDINRDIANSYLGSTNISQFHLIKGKFSIFRKRNLRKQISGIENPEIWIHDSDMRSSWRSFELKLAYKYLLKDKSSIMIVDRPDANIEFMKFLRMVVQRKEFEGGCLLIDDYKLTAIVKVKQNSKSINVSRNEYYGKK